MYLDPGQHACGGHTEVQVGQHLSCRGLINVWRPLSGEVIWKKEGSGFGLLSYWTNRSQTFTLFLLVLLFAIQSVMQPDNC